MTVATRRTRISTLLRYSSAAAALSLSPLALAGDEPTPAQKIDKASQQISEAIAGLQSIKLDKADHDKHLDKARSLLARARAELLQAQGQAKSE